MTSLSSSMKARQSRGNAMVNYSMTLGRMPAPEDDEVHTRTEPFLDDVPGILKDMEHTMAAAKAYRDDLVSDAKAGNQWREVWEVVERPTPQYIADRMDIEKEFLTTKPRAGKASRYIRKAEMEPPLAMQQRPGSGKAQLQRSRGNTPARHCLDYSTKWKVEQYVKQPLTPDTQRPRQLRQRMEEMVAAEEEAMIAKAAQADITDNVGLSLMMLERKQQQTQKYTGNRVSLQQQQQPGTTAMARRHGAGSSRPVSAAALGHHGSPRQASTHQQQRPQTAYPASGLDISGPGTDGGQQSSGGSQPYAGPKSHSYSGYMSQSEAKYEKLISTMQDMGDFAALSEMHDAPPPETSDLQTWVSGFKEKNEQKVQAAAAAAAEESAGLFAEASEGSTISSSQHPHQAGSVAMRSSDALRAGKSVRGKSMLGRLSEEGSASAFGDPAAEPQDEQTKSLMEFNTVLNFLINYSTETEKARMDLNNKKTSIYKAAKVARKQHQFPLDLVEQYVDAAKSGIQGLESLDQMLAHVRQQSQVVAEESGIRAGHSGSQMYLPIEVDLQLEILGQVQGDLGKLLEDDESEAPEDAAMEQEPQTPRSSVAGSPYRKSQLGREFGVPRAAGPHGKGRSRQASSPRKTQQPGTGSRGPESQSGSINSTEVKRLMGWLNRIVTKLSKRNAAESTDVMEITEKFRCATKLSSLTTNAGTTAAATVKDYDPESMSELLYFLLSSVMQLRDGPYRELGSLMSVALQSLVGEIQWLLAMLRANQGANSPHVQMLVAVIRGMHAERLMRGAAEEHIKAMASAADADKTRTKMALSRADDLGEKLVAKEKALVLLKGDLAEHQDELRILRERVKALETEVKVLEGDMTLAGNRALATAHVVKQGVKFQGTLKNANLACKWNLLSKGVQATGNGRADDPNAEVLDIPEPEPLVPELPMSEASRTSKKHAANSTLKSEGKKSPKRSLGRTLGSSRGGAG